MSFVPREAGRGRGGRPVGWHQHQGRPLGVAMEAAAGDGDPMESVVDPDMVALFDDFLGRVEEFSTSALVPAGAQPYHYVVRDTEHKGLYLRDGRLVAANLQGANADQEEPISVVPNRHLERQRCPLLVGIRGGTKALSCGTGPEPRLQLEDAAIPYTFYKTFGGSTHSFEAAAFPGHFLSTAPQSDQELGLAPRTAPGSITSFYLRRR
ncbi:interleukin-36 receptor antagonist protein-like isoform X2 [Phasianus colchicus]|uniref:interleukin-36 receptor antagonist protein-like isoform X2 n=1 Tax=Phasianus colchicus TaxID=9054 RepID=UPI00129D615B|nr:interleukin-36 receptor antagonist protein-like isoform X2 [Phasianus colchicus]